MLRNTRNTKKNVTKNGNYVNYIFDKYFRPLKLK